MIRVEKLHKTFGSNKVLQGLNLEVADGETVVILGPSGVGKSVLLKHIIGLVKPDSGRVFVNEHCVSEQEGTELFSSLRGMGMLFQGAALFDSMSVFDNVVFYLSNHGDPDTGRRISRKELLCRAGEALEMVGLAGTEDKMPADLSGGMRKRAALARLICYRPQVLLYDEPTAGLDPITAMQINDLIVKTQRELKATSIVVTHDLRCALEVGDRLCVHRDGKLNLLAPKDEFIHSKDPLVESFLRNVSINQFLQKS